MKAFRLALWGAVAVLGLFLGYQTVTGMIARGDGSNAAYNVADIGGPFVAQTASGEAITEAEMRGRPHVLFFGFTHCPDVCPTTLYEASQWLEKLGPRGDDLDVYFVTVDPTRDDAATLESYLSPFDKRITGITGTEEQTNAMAKAWRVFAQKVPLDDGDYTINHTASTFLMRPDGEFFGTIAYGEDAEVAVQKLNRLLDSSS